MKGYVALRKPVGTAIATLAPITQATYVQLSASLPAACSGILASNSGASPLLLATGASGQEKDLGIIIPPGSNQGVTIPIELAKGVRLSVHAALADQASGTLTIGFFA